MKPGLRILMVVHTPWERNLGCPRVQLELAEELRRRSHEVEKFDYHDAFPKKNPSMLMDRMRPELFSLKVRRFVKTNASRFDVIDANQGDIPFSKEDLGFSYPHRRPVYLF